MKVTIEDVSTVKKTLHVEVPEANVTEALNSAYQDLKRNVKVKGFRPGKTPRSVLERLYQKDVHADVAGRLIQDSFTEAVKTHDLKLAGKPEVNPPQLVKKSPFSYDATIEVFPELDPIDFKGLSLEKSLYKVDDNEVEAQLKMLQTNMARNEPLTDDRPVQQDDIVVIDYESFENDQPNEDTQKTIDFLLKIGEGRIHEDLDMALTGMQRGDEKDVKLQFGDDHYNKNLAGRTLTFRVWLKEIRAEVLPELNDSFARNFGHYKTLDELKEKIAENLQEGYDKRAEREMNTQIFKKLLAKTDFEVPDSLVEQELDSIIKETAQSLAAQNMNFESAGLDPDQMRKENRDVAVKHVRRQLILNKIIDQEKLVLSDDEMETGLTEMAESLSQPDDVIKNYIRAEDDRLAYFKHGLLEKKAIKLIIENSDVREVMPAKDKEVTADAQTDETVATASDK